MKRETKRVEDLDFGIDSTRLYSTIRSCQQLSFKCLIGGSLSGSIFQEVNILHEDMLGTLRNKFQTVQEGLSASIRGLTVVENPKQKKTVKSRNVNYDAGADILHHFQLEWNELHELAELNAFKAQKVDTLITKIYGKLEYEWNNITYLNNTLALIPQINNGIQNLMDQIGTLEEMFEEVEGALYKLEDLNEMIDLQSRQLDHRFQLALYKEKRLSEINSVKAKLANEHIDRVSKHEQKQQLMLKERQETFDEVFKGELEAYKATGYIPKIPTTKEGPSLDEIVLDVDSKMFDEFLEN